MVHVFKHTTDEWSDFYGGGGFAKTSDFVNIDEDKFSQWIVDVTNEKLLSTEYGDGWTLDDYEVNIQMDIGKVCENSSKENYTSDSAYILGI